MLAEGTTKILLSKDYQQQTANGNASGKMRAPNRAKALDAKGPSPPSILYTLFRMFKHEFILASLIKLLADLLQFANPLLLR